MAKHRKLSQREAFAKREADRRTVELGFAPLLGSDEDGRGKFDEDGNRRIKKLPEGP